MMACTPPRLRSRRHARRQRPRPASPRCRRSCRATASLPMTTRRCATASATARATSSNTRCTASAPKSARRGSTRCIAISSSITRRISARERGLYPGLLELLDRFAAAGWILCRLHQQARKACHACCFRELGLEAGSRRSAAATALPHRKPDPAHLLQTIAAASGTPEAAIMVGDSRTDLDTARSAGIPFVGVTFGYTPVPMAELGPDMLIDAYDELLPRARRCADRRRIRTAGPAGCRRSRHALISRSVAPIRPVT